MADSVARDFARKLVQIECQLQSLLASHRTVFFYLRVECCLRCHRKILTCIELERAILCVDANGLAFADFAFEDVDAKRIENFFLDCALEWTRSVNRIVTFARDQFLGGIGKIERDLLLLEPFRQAAKLDFDNLFEVIFCESIKNYNLIDAIEKLGTKMGAQCVCNET